MLSEEVNSLLSNFDWICLVLVSEEWALDLGCIHLELLKSTSSESISADKSYSPASLHVLVSKLGTSCCFTRSLETNEHDNVWLASNELVWLVFRAQHFCKLIDYYLEDSPLEILSSNVWIIICNTLQFDLG